MHIVTISVNGSTLDADVIDIEPGNLSVAAGVQWCIDKIAHGQRPTVYASRSWVPTITAGLQARGVDLARVDWWVADWTGTPHLVPGSVATQYANPPSSGGSYDVSITDGSWPFSVSPTPPAPTPAPSPDRTCPVNLRILQKAMTGGDVKSLQKLLGIAHDGIFGPATESAVRTFQASHKIAVDGIVGSTTWTTIIAVG